MTNKLDQPDLIDIVCAGIASGQWLPDVAKGLDIPFHLLFKWIEGDPSNKRAYESATRARDELVHSDVMARLRAMTGVDLRLILDEHGEILPVSKWPDREAAAVQGLDISHGKDSTSKKLKLSDILKAIELQAKLMGKFVERKELTGSLTLADLVGAAQGDSGGPSDSSK